MRKYLPHFVLVFLGVGTFVFWFIKGQQFELKIALASSWGVDLISVLAWAFSIALGYLLSRQLIGTFVRFRRGSSGDTKMLTTLLHVLLVAAVVFFLARMAGFEGKMDTVFGAFTGMFLGMVMQTPANAILAWLFITMIRPFRIGDRVIIHGIAGDVEKVGFMYTTMTQVGGTVSSEERSDRAILIPNTTLWGAVVTNYTPQVSAPYVLDECMFRFTYGSNWDKATEILLTSARKATTDIIAATKFEPYIRADVFDYGILMRVRYMAPAVDRPRVVHEITRLVVQGVQKCEDVDFCIPFVYSFKKGSGVQSYNFETIPQASSPIARELRLREIVLGPEAAAREPIDESALQDLTRIIRAHGVPQPITVEQTASGAYTLVSGRPIFEACVRLGWETIPAFVVGNGHGRA